MNPGDHLIWSDYNLDYEDWRADLEAEYPELSEDQRVALMYERNADYLDDERLNLNIDVGRPILVVGDLGLWYGRRQGYKEVPSGNIRDCLYPDQDYSTWFVDAEGDLRCDSVHHDGSANRTPAIGTSATWQNLFHWEVFTASAQCSVNHHPFTVLIMR